MFTKILSVKDSWVAKIQIIVAIISHEKESCSSEKCIQVWSMKCLRKAWEIFGLHTKKQSKVIAVVPSGLRSQSEQTPGKA